MQKPPGMEGLRLVLRQPALGMAEIVWRWSFATTSWLLCGYLAFGYLDTLPVTNGDLFLLRSGVPALTFGAIQHILLSGRQRLVTAALICLITMCMAWVFAASVGRTATISVLLDRANIEATNSVVVDSQNSPTVLSRLLSKTVLTLHALRAALLLGMLVAFLGAVVVAGSASSYHGAHPAIGFLLFLFLAGAIATLWCALDWLLSTAPIFAIRDGESTLGAISETVTLVCERFGALVRSSGLFGTIHLVVFFVVISLLSVLLPVARMFSPGAMVLLILTLALLYFALIDFLRVARLAAYINIAVPEPNIQPAAAEQ
jgi:hypothetical protein